MHLKTILFFFSILCFSHQTSILWHKDSSSLSHQSHVIQPISHVLGRHSRRKVKTLYNIRRIRNKRKKQMKRKKNCILQSCVCQKKRGLHVACRRLPLEHKNSIIKSFYKNSKTYLKGYKVHTLAITNISSIPAFSFLGFSVTNLIINNNYLSDKVHMAAFKGSDVRNLWMNWDKLDYIPTFTSLFNLKSLHLQHNRFTSIPSRAFVHNMQLQELVLSDNIISQLHFEAFHGLLRLKHLLLKANKLKRIETNAFQTLRSLVDLDLSDNQIEVLGANIFKPLKNLKSLDLSGNLLKILSAKSFVGLNKLHNLELENNQIFKIKKATFKMVPTLKFLSFNASKLLRFEQGSFGDLSELKRISIGELPARLLHSKSNETYEGKIFANLHKLKTVSISNYTGNFVGLQLEDFPKNFNFLQLSIFAVKMECTCEKKWIRQLTDKGAYVHGFCLDFQPISCINRSFDHIRMFERTFIT